MALRSWDTENAPSGTMMSVSESGWTKQGLAQLWFEDVFLKNIGPERPQALIFDGHDSHHHVEIINSAIQNRIVLIELPSHTSNWLQPLDRTFFGPMKTKWRKQLSNLMAETACTVSHANFFRLFSKVWGSMVAEPEKLRNGFVATGICPFNPNAIPEEAYEPSKHYAEKSIKGESKSRFICSLKLIVYQF
ncbi:uncharacterized protein [Argopecten irradians]|uniref:uncharacterized protein n=1 Tax=Argopecten irradians TaxID=31199 RepID=UPI003722475C